MTQPGEMPRSWRDEHGDGDAEEEVAEDDDGHGDDEEADDEGEVKQRLLRLDAGQRQPGLEIFQRRRREARANDPANRRNGPPAGVMDRHCSAVSLLAEHEADDEADAHGREDGPGGILADPMFALAAEGLGAGAGLGVGMLGLAADFVDLGLGGGAQLGGLGLGGGAQVVDGLGGVMSCRR